ncbi:glucose-6-phosphate isomerase [Salinicola sp. LHM]|uniref:glucose-6-phosphate isomerase n=1 Tax=Salinicola TaxID=404432 RepID=UPI0008DE0DFD|nr:MULTISPECIES: glucose-6-phosphate isomerase [Salinicola]MDF3919695.1 glucose-6-phosphate isomerase [Salinicola salarius]OHZ01422.1 glucose-6-phosphate isomerase [Salinicola sp. MIT1003]WQH32054.1 glucose-6-phosphate isomerase [Salinicola sp. LHM]
MSIRETQAWKALEQQLEGGMREVHLKTLFQQSPRFETFYLEAAGIQMDLSKQRWTTEVREQLLSLAREAGVPEAVQRLLSGERVNHTEDRPALHTALRLPRDARLEVEGVDVVGEVHATLDKMETLVNKLLNGQWRGATGKPITDVVNLGVGGSDLGPLMVTSALTDFEPDDVFEVSTHFASTMDGSQLADFLSWLNPETTLFILSSKSFGTIDTLSNASTALDWIATRLGGDEALIKRFHFVGVSTKPDKMTEWGIDPANQLLFWDWVGGRYSLWSAIGLPIAIRVGMDNFRQLLAGAHAMDEHFRTAELKDNLPVQLALIGIWNVNFLDIRSHAVLPYDGRLKHLPGYFQQLEMESNGKSVTNNDEVVDYSTCPVIWGEIGPNGQHAFYQLLHQGTQPVACDFIAPVNRYNDVEDERFRDDLMAQHRLALANCFAQSRVLMLGDDAVKSESTPPSYKRYRGNQPSSTLMFDSLNPATLGALIALYEHKVFVQGVIWDIDSFDQWGVELGKKIATETEEIIATQNGLETLDDSSRGLIKAIWKGQESR